jgi:hypothetical protein
MEGRGRMPMLIGRWVMYIEGKYGNYEEREERWERTLYYTVVPSSSPASQHCFSIEKDNKIHIRGAHSVQGTRPSKSLSSWFYFTRADAN